MSRKEGQDA